jgi:acyl-CoA reductase-like NAD-dependent aldehyde dehydrogenase
VFGPVARVAGFDRIDKAIAVANGSPFGLQLSVLTRHLSAVLRFPDDFDVGAL